MICLGICRGKVIVCSLWLFQTSYYFTHLFLLVYLPPTNFPKESPFPIYSIRLFVLLFPYYYMSYYPIILIYSLLTCFCICSPLPREPLFSIPSSDHFYLLVPLLFLPICLSKQQSHFTFLVSVVTAGYVLTSVVEMLLIFLL